MRDTLGLDEPQIESLRYAEDVSLTSITPNQACHVLHRLLDHVPTALLWDDLPAPQGEAVWK